MDFLQKTCSFWEKCLPHKAFHTAPLRNPKQKTTLQLFSFDITTKLTIYFLILFIYMCKTLIANQELNYYFLDMHVWPLTTNN